MSSSQSLTHKIIRWSSPLIFALQCLLLFLLFFESGVQIPTWLQPLGRMHPMLLHLPIGFLLVLAILDVIKKELAPEVSAKLQQLLVHLTSLACVLSALFGLFLSQEEGYLGDLVFWHKWSAVVLNFLVYAFLITLEYWADQKILASLFLWTSIALMLVAGHLGGELTHGENFIWAPLQKETMIVTAETPIYQALVFPVIENKCLSCHNERKAKGDLIMTSPEQILKGGKHGSIWSVADPDSSHVLQMLRRPIEDDLHMPPKGKSQPSDTEIQHLADWIAAGADFDLPLAGYIEYPDIYTRFAQAIEALLSDPTQRSYDFAFADPAVVKSLNTPFRSVRPVALGLPALEANIFVRAAYQPAFLSDLLQVNEQIISLNLTNLPITDADLETLARFTNLEMLRLNGTDITGATLGQLASCSKLTSLALANTALQVDLSDVLTNLPSLEKVYLWNTRVSDEALAKLQATYPAIYFDHGFQPEEGERLKLSAPSLQEAELVLPPGKKVTLGNIFAGATIRYTTDGSDPDSITSPIYSEPLAFDDQLYVRARAFKEGWAHSEVAEYMFFRAGIRAERAVFLYPSDLQFAGSGAHGLIDFEKGNARELFSPYWVGFKENALDAYLFFSDTNTVRKIIISYCHNVDGDQFPPASVEVWAGDDEKHLTKITRALPASPSADDERRVSFFAINLPPTRAACYRIVAQPVSSLPAWHEQKGKKAFLMVDEILFY